MTIKVGGGGGGPWTIFPSPPHPLKNEGLVSKIGDVIPHKGTLINQINMPTAFSTSATGDYIGLLGTSTIWTINATDVNAGASGWCGIHSSWYDSVNDRLYVFALETTSNPDVVYLAYITLETGAIFNVGNVQLGTDPTGFSSIANCNTKRGAIDSGNFTLQAINRTIVINESTGAEVSNVAATPTTEGSPPGTYTTLDGLILVNTLSYGSSSNSWIEVTRGGDTCRVNVAASFLADSASASSYFINWGDKVKLVQFGSTVQTRLLRTYLRTELDNWFAELCDIGGLA